MPLSGDRRIITCGVDGQVRLAELNIQGVCNRKLASHKGVATKVTVQ